MLFEYTAFDKDGEKQEGTIDTVNKDIAISSLQRRGLVISSISKVKENNIFKGGEIPFLTRVSTRDLVIISQQIATLFEAQVSALQVFRLISSEAENSKLRTALDEVATDIQGGSSIAEALEKHEEIFSPYYVSMVKAGEETGKLDQTFRFLAESLDRSYEVNSKARNALIYPAFVITAFIGVMVLMFTIVIPKISSILTESGQDLPIYTKIVLGTSNFFVNYWILLIIAVIAGAVLFIRFVRTEEGALSWDRFKLSIPYVGDLYRKLYLSRFADNMQTMIASGIPMVRSLEITKDVVDSKVYEEMLNEVAEDVRGGSSLSASIGQFEEMPGIIVQMVRVGEETGELGKMLNTMASFYRREVNNAVDTLIGLIEPAMIVILGGGVAVLLASVLMPIYNLAGGF